MSRKVNEETAEGRIILVTGMSGAGRTSTLHVFEDIGFEAIDNLHHRCFRSRARRRSGRALAIGVGIGTRDFADDAFARELGRLRDVTNGSVTTISWIATTTSLSNAIPRRDAGIHWQTINPWLTVSNWNGACLTPSVTELTWSSIRVGPHPGI